MKKIKEKYISSDKKHSQSGVRRSKKPEPISDPPPNFPKLFDAYEVKPVVSLYDIDSGQEYYTSYESLEEALATRGEGEFLYWMLFGHRKGEGLEAIADFDSEEDAFHILYSITGIVGTPGKQVYILDKERGNG